MNRRGPSELDRAMEMMGRLAGTRPPTQPRKNGNAQRIARGTVSHIDRVKGYGFLVDAMGEQRFFHRSAVAENGFPSLKEQQAVEFEPHSDERGARALNVRPAGTTPKGPKPAQPTKPTAKSPKAPAWRSDLSPFRGGFGAPSHPRKLPRI